MGPQGIFKPAPAKGAAKAAAAAAGSDSEEGEEEEEPEEPEEKEEEAGSDIEAGGSASDSGQQPVWLAVKPPAGEAPAGPVLLPCPAVCVPGHPCLLVASACCPWPPSTPPPPPTHPLLSR